MYLEVWPPREVTALERRLDELVEVVMDDHERSIDEQGYLARFLVIRASGYLEQVAYETLRGHLSVRSNGMVRSFSLSWIERSRNPSAYNLLEIVGRLDATLRNDLDALLDADDARMKRELGYLLHCRNLIAHGMNESVGTRRALDLVDLTKELADWFIRRLNPNTRT